MRIKSHYWQHLLIGIPAFLVAAMNPAHAQIVTDGTLGPGGSPSGPNYQIPASLGRKIGKNLFHSFLDFQLHAGESANFSGPASVRNILSRVTGGNPSVINGQLNSSIAGANFFFINPAGTIFGPSAQINVGGNFVATTADVLHLADGGQFNAREPAATVLTSAAPAAFGFLTPNPKPIFVIGSQLDAAPGQSIGLIGGDISLQAGAILQTQDGNINLVSVGSQGTASSYDLSNFSKLGTVSITEGSKIRNVGQGGIVIRSGRLFVEGADSLITAENDTSGPAGGIDVDSRGSVEIRDGANVQTLATNSGAGPNIVIRTKRLFIGKDSALASATYGTGRGGDVNVIAQDVALDATGASQDFNGLGALSFGDGNGGNLTLQADTLKIMGGADISAGNAGHGSGGGVFISAGDIVVRGDGSTILAQSVSPDSGRGGNISIASGNLKVLNGGAISSVSLGTGDAGDITILANDVLVSGGSNQYATINAGTGGSGHGGNIDITAATLRLNSGAEISADTGGSGNGGTVKINAGSIDLRGKGQTTGIFARTGGGGKGGEVSLATGTLHLQGDAVISTQVFDTGHGGSVQIQADDVVIDGTSGTGLTGIFADSFSTGHGGTIQIGAKNLEVINQALISTSSFDQGNGGGIIIKADSIALDGAAGTGLFAVAKSTGHGGNMVIDAGSLKVLSAAEIVTNTAGAGNAGSLDITAKDILLDGRGTQFLNGIGSESRLPNAGAAGPVSIKADRLTLLDGATISTSTVGKGNGGNLTIQAGDIVLDDNGGNAASIAAQTVGQNPDSGDGGPLSVTANNITLLGQSTISASSGGPGDGGPVSITANKIILDGRNTALGASITAEAADPVSNAIGGNIDLRTNTLEMRNNAKISSATNGGGRGGPVTVTAGKIAMENSAFIASITTGGGQGGPVTVNANSLHIDGKGNLTGITSDTSGSGDGGRVIVDVKELKMQNGGYISASSLNQGNSGQVDIHAGSATLDNSYILALSRGTGEANTVNLTVDGSLSVRNGSRINTQADNTNGGNINLKVGDRFLIDGDSVLNAAAAVNGGNIRIQVDGGLRAGQAGIGAFAGNNGGDITVEGWKLRSPRYVTLDRSFVLASAILGNGGNINIRSNVFLRSVGTVIDASSQFGVAGNVAVDSPNTNVGGSLVLLSSNLLSAENYLAERCVIRQTGQSSSFTVSTQSGVPAQPGDLLPSPAAR